MGTRLGVFYRAGEIAIKFLGMRTWGLMLLTLAAPAFCQDSMLGPDKKQEAQASPNRTAPPKVIRPGELKSSVCSIPLLNAIPQKTAPSIRMPDVSTPEPRKGDVIDVPAPPCSEPLPSNIKIR